MEQWMKNYLHNTDITIFQSKEMFRMNTDTRLLGEFMRIKKGEVVLDVGTNNGALLLYAAQKQPKKLIGVELNPQACELARYNLQYNGVPCFEIAQADAKDYVGEMVDVVVCNPPYFETHHNSNLNVNESLKMARHETYLQLDQLMELLRRNLKEGGRFYMVHRAQRISDLLIALQGARMGVRTIQFIHDEHRDCASGVLIEAIKGQQANVKVLNPVVITR
ncbi:MAG: tRNA1(Val) (adenine(37)-N6)-methyltransferase [Erysipelotrichaceae bacterium]